MKNGVIVYVAGSERMRKDFDPEKAVKGLDIKADQIEVVLSDEYDQYFMDAWWKLIARGMGLIVCKMAEVVHGSRLELTGRELRLFG